MRRVGKALAAGAAVLRGLTDARRRAPLAHHLRDYMEDDGLVSDLDGAHPPLTRPAPGTETLGVGGGLLVTTSAGLFLLADGQWKRLLATAGYGVAVDGAGTLFAVASPGGESHVLRATIEGSGAATRLAAVRRLCGFHTRYHGERLHQIAWDPARRALLCANTRRNSLLTVDPDSGAYRDETFVLTDRFGYPIRTDHNHVNGVAGHSEAILFSVHTLGEGGGLGFVAEGRARVYAYPGRGLHDVLIHDGGLMFTDSFRNARMGGDPTISGAVVHKGREILAEPIDALPAQYVLRGLAARDGTLYVGGSIYAKRDRRFEESGGAILVLRDGAVAAVVDGPFSQVYDVLPLDGIRTDHPGAPRDAADLHEMFLRDVGSCVYDQPVVVDPLTPALT
jgi:sugar lactone lactonase YvrE